MNPRLLKVHRTPTARDVPYVPTNVAVVAALLRLAQVTADDCVYDLGCGDGRIVISAAKRFGARGIGIDIDPVRIQEARENARSARMEHLVAFNASSFFDADLSQATVVAMYLLPGINARLRPKLLAEMPVGARVVTHHFDMSDWKPDVQLEAHHERLYLWRIPARIAGEWQCVVDDPAQRRRMTLRLSNLYQVVTGSAVVGGRPTPIGLGRIDGDMLSFRLVEWGRGAAVMRYSAQVAGDTFRGHCWEESAPDRAVPWCGTRQCQI